MKGNGHSVSLISEEEMMDKIISAVEASQDRDYWRYEGYDSSYVLEAKVLVLNDAPAVSWDLEPYNDETYRPYQVVKRPYDPEQPSGEDYIYDVRMWNDGSTFTDSLDCIGINILFTIYDNITK